MSCQRRWWRLSGLNNGGGGEIRTSDRRISQNRFRALPRQSGHPYCGIKQGWRTAKEIGASRFSSVGKENFQAPLR
jgi:hypothetical protein